jgi:hypothetical protein
MAYRRGPGRQRSAGAASVACFAEGELLVHSRLDGMKRVGLGDRTKGCASPRLIVYSATTEGARVNVLCFS